MDHVVLVYRMEISGYNSNWRSVLSRLAQSVVGYSSSRVPGNHGNQGSYGALKSLKTLNWGVS